ncbi:hypothetical protein IT412_05250 [Candidatus Peregrinibacteria bacterium]|nr:hypothetical protein [Candidatus Peregrinibacteria bacterium]
MEKTIRIYSEGQLTESQLQNLFWIKSGYLYHGVLKGEKAIRALRILELWLPVKEDNFDERDINNFTKSDECFYVDSCLLDAQYDLIVSVRQIGKVAIGNVKIWSRKLRREFA